MTNRLRHSIFLYGGIFGLTSIAYLHSFSASPNSILGTLILCLCVASLAVLSLNILRYTYAHFMHQYWRDTEVMVDVLEYPVKTFKFFVGGWQLNIYIAGVNEEVDECTTPFEFGMPSHINYVIHVEDLCYMDEEEIAEHLNETYLCFFEVEEK